MSIQIDPKKCVGCRKCLAVCPGSLLKMGEDKKAYIKYPKDCWGCASCVKECKQCAIGLYLGADMGGRGSSLTVKKKDELLQWLIEESDGTQHIIEVNANNSNQY